MSPKERWQAVLTRQKPDRVPMDYWATWEATQKLMKHLDCDYDTMLQKLHIDTPLVVHGIYKGPQPPANEDIFGRKIQQIEYDGGIYNEPDGEPPLAKYNSVEEIEAEYRWPNPDDWDYSHLPAQVQGQDHRPIKGGGSEPLLLYKLLRGEQQAFMDMIDNPEIVHYCLDKLFELAYQETLRIFETIPGKVLITYIAEDVGSQKGLMYSPAQINEFLIPRMKRMADLTKQHGSYVFHHSDGSVKRILPDMIEKVGIEILNPIQWRCPGMEREELKADFGDKLVFHGAVDNQYTLPFGSVDEVRQEVEDNLRILGEGGGYILAPCHNIQAVSPPENIVAMYESGYELGWS